MIHIGEPLLQPFLFAMALIYIALISQPVWASDNPGQLALPVQIEYVDANDTKYGYAYNHEDRTDIKYG